jgi:hypothetical protein
MASLCARRLWTDRVSAPAIHNAGRTEWQASAFAYCRRSSVEQATWLSGLEYFRLRALQQVDEPALGARVTVDIGLRVLD